MESSLAYVRQNLLSDERADTAGERSPKARALPSSGTKRRAPSLLGDQLSSRGVEFDNANLLPSVAHINPIDIPPIVTGHHLAEVHG